MIGLYGMPGVGKTTLAEVVGKQVQEKEQKLFDKVVIVTVSQTPDINKIQDKIADIFGLKFEKNSKEGKAEELWRRLKGEKKILIILDDVWKKLELQTIGIPFGGEHEGCKILLTTRLQQVCIQMNCQEKFELEILSEDKAWALFKDNASLEHVSLTVNDVAKEVARECKGLPLAIVTVANALKGESLDGWIAANQRLKDSRPLDNQDVCGDIYSCLQLSYDYLKEDNIQSCFLLCSLFPEDYEIDSEQLTVIGLGLGLFCDINLIEDLRREIRLALSKLQKSGLLLETDDEESVKMHDVVRDFAHWITSTGEKMFMVKNELTEWPNSENFGCYTAISLWNSKIDNFPERLEFSKLKTLILSGTDYQIVPRVGKTTLAEVVLKQATEQKLFDKVVSVTVSQTPNFNEIRERIAELFGLKFEARTENGKAEELWRKLKAEKKILIILDDVWKKLELQTIGIPFGGEHEGCKILLTTRLQQVCSQMDCQKEFKLNILSEDEAWALFEDKAALKDDSSTSNVAQEVAHECGGLPLAIVTVANALKGENLDGWIAANRRLKSSRHLDNQDVCGGIYGCLKLSYDYLKEENIQSCFLLCSLFPEDYQISVELLTVCGIGQGLFNNNYLMEDLRREIHLALSKLQKSGLLLEADDQEHVKMHDVIRDFAHWITSTGENIFMVKDGLMEWPMSERFGYYTAISLWNIEIKHLPNKVEFSKLKILFLKGKNSLRVSCAFFERMTTLRVLLLQDVVLTLKALQFLTNLRT
ncbi:NB-ARC - like 10, partial [Theobroma cacao]